MKNITIYHNNRCSKSRSTLAIVESIENANVEIVNYLDTPPTIDALKKIVSQLGFESVRSLMRTGEAVYKELDLKTELDESVLLQAMLTNPILIERPIVIANGKAKIGRPPESVLAILEVD